MSDTDTVISREILDTVAAAVRNVLVANRIEHVFFGGYRMIVFGADRTTQDVDIVVPKGLLGDSNFNKTRKAFEEAVGENAFWVFEGNRKDAIRLIHKETRVGVDVMLQKLPNSPLVSTQDPLQLPFFPATHMLAKKVECLAGREKLADSFDLVWIWNNESIDEDKLRKKVQKEHLTAALIRKANNPEVLEVLNRIKAIVG